MAILIRSAQIAPDRLKLPKKTTRPKLPPIHPGDILQDVLNEAGLHGDSLALALRVPANRIGGILKASAASLATPPYGWHATSARLPKCG
jgi:hypothetical protein